MDDNLNVVQTKDMPTEEILQKIVNEDDQVKREVIARQISITKSGPLPDAEEFAKYEQALPGAGDRILKMAEELHKHKIELTSKEQVEFHKSNNKFTMLGVITSTIISIGGITGSVLLGIYGQSWASGIIGVLSLGSIVANILEATSFSFKNKNKSEIEEE